ncbi:MAG: FAD-linked oxidase C-terminal domain-containing protein [Candidatus Margulisiibacteriota bacterium]
MNFDAVNSIENRPIKSSNDYRDYSSFDGIEPNHIFFPKTHDECERLLKWANKENHVLVIRGAGTGTTGGALTTTAKQIIICLSKMNRIINFDIKNATITVEPGVLLEVIHKTVESKGLFYPPDPASLKRCSIGGNIAENAGGPRALKYGVTKDYVIGLKGVWANGESFEYGGKIKKNVAGYDLISLLVGSEGTLALLSEITLKLRPKPKKVREAIACYASSKKALEALNKTLQSGILPSTAEFITKECVQAAQSYMNEPLQLELHPSYVIWQVDGFTEAEVNQQLAAIEALGDAEKFIPMRTSKFSDHIWSIRRNVSLGLKKVANKKFSEDIVVPVANVPEVIQELEALTHPSGIKVLGYGHLGDGNIHVNILKMSAEDSIWAKASTEIIQKVMGIAIAYGGSISGEHGIGIAKKQYLPLMFNSHDLNLMKQIKRHVDPNWILNPGKVFDQ